MAVLAQRAERGSDGAPCFVAVDDARVDVGGPGYGGRVAQVLGYLRTTRAMARLRALSLPAAYSDTARPTAASTVACQVRKSLAVKSPAEISRR